MTIPIPPYKPLNSSLRDIKPLKLICVQTEAPELEEYFDTLCTEHHYLTTRKPRGNYLSYLVTSKDNDVLACLMFSEPAWKLQPREQFIGWNESVKKENLRYIANNSRFVILKKISVRNLATHILGRIQKRLSDDWKASFGDPLYLLETFIDESRNSGACYKADNWLKIGELMIKKGNKELIGKNLGIYLKSLKKDFKDFLLQRN